MKYLLVQVPVCMMTTKEAGHFIDRAYNIISHSSRSCIYYCAYILHLQLRWLTATQSTFTMTMLESPRLMTYNLGSGKDEIS